MRTTTRIVIATATAALAGCLSFGQQETQRYYVLEAARANARAILPSRSSTLLITPATASGFYETPEIVYSRAPGERAYYQLSAWTERPNQRITELLMMRLERAGLFRTVASAASGVQGDVVLNTHLAEFFHDSSTAPGTVKVTIAAALIDPTRRTVFARRTFEQSAAAATYDAAGAVQAFNKATAAILDDISEWVDASAPR
jgi:cholesterol transport system auxiliary component